MCGEDSCKAGGGGGLLHNSQWPGGGRWGSEAPISCVRCLWLEINKYWFFNYPGRLQHSLWRDLLWLQESYARLCYDLHIYISITDQALAGSPSLPDMFGRSTRCGWRELRWAGQQSAAIINLQHRSVRKLEVVEKTGKFPHIGREKYGNHPPPYIDF